MDKSLSLILAWLALAVFDACFSAIQISKRGIQVELNPGIRKLVGHFGVWSGTCLGVGVPAIALATLLAHFPTILAMLVGMRIMLTLGQLVSLAHSS